MTQNNLLLKGKQRYVTSKTKLLTLSCFRYSKAQLAFIKVFSYYVTV